MDTSIISTKVTPLMQQYAALKAQYAEYLLFYRLGDFYELFDKDAVVASQALNIVLTKRGDVPMCGIPAHSCESYLYKLIECNFRVAICDQLETPEEAKKRGFKAIVKRDVVRIITPGTIIEDSLLDAKNSNYLACITQVANHYAIAWLELSTGSFFYNSTTYESMISDILRISPKELLMSDKFSGDEKLQNVLTQQKIYVTQHADSLFDPRRAETALRGFYKIETLAGIGQFSAAEVSSCGALIEYVKMTQKGSIPRLELPQTYQKSNFMLIDTAARNNLELLRSQSGEVGNSLLSIIDHTKTAPGARLLRRHLSSPLACANAINTKLQTVEFFVQNQTMCREIRDVLGITPDLERLLSRIMLGKGSPKDVSALAIALHNAMKISGIIAVVQEPEIRRFYTSLGEYGQLLEILDNALLTTNLVNTKDGGFINPQYNPQLAELLHIQQNSTDLIGKLRDSYRKLTGIAALKINFNNVIGYYIEVSANHVIKIDTFIHRQSLASSVRYTTTELKELESKIITAKDASVALEENIFQELCAQIGQYAEMVALASHTIAELDVATSFAYLAVENKYVKPVVDNSQSFEIINGRHPVVEQNRRFIANSIDLSGQQQVYLITGPNMAGKSTFLRQNALIAILAHLGSFVPADHAHIGVIDQVFSRVGASDNISAGHSTFMVEMVETAATLNHATDRSLVILDEVGRGTGTSDGLSIAWAVVEHLHDVTHCRTMFATHYHELSQLEKSLTNLKCFHMAVEEWQNEVAFLHKIVPGATNKSYGIHVAKMAGLPYSVIARAETLAEKFQSD